MMAHDSNKKKSISGHTTEKQQLRDIPNTVSTVNDGSTSRNMGNEKESWISEDSWQSDNTELSGIPRKVLLKAPVVVRNGNDTTTSSTTPIQPEVTVHEEEEEERSNLKLGLGDFVFYSVLVSRAGKFLNLNSK